MSIWPRPWERAIRNYDAVSPENLTSRHVEIILQATSSHFNIIDSREIMSLVNMRIIQRKYSFCYHILKRV
jgi:hypothetical protein